VIVGAVNTAGDAIIPIRVRGPAGAATGVEAVVDTGFNDWLTLPAVRIDALGLELREAARFVLANGALVSAGLYAAEVQWHGEWRRVLVVGMEGGPLVGMAMLAGSHLGIDVIEQGRVQVSPLRRT
jgi:clan AA aspartic protease